MLSKKLQSCVLFSRFAKEHKIEPRDLAELCQLADRVAALNVRFSNGDDVKEKLYKMQAKMAAKAKAAGFKVEYNGVGPTLVKDKYDYWLPD